jgi:ankyrin repeat protein
MIDTFYRNCNVNATDDHNMTPLYIAARWNHASAVRLLLDKGADMNVFDDEYGDRPIHAAAEEGHYE